MTPVMRATPAAAAAQPQTPRWDGWRCHLLLLAVCVMLLLDTFLNHVYHDEEALLQGQDWREMSRDAVTLAAGTLAVYRWAIRRHGEGLTAQTAAFTAAGLGEVFYAETWQEPFAN